MACDSPVFYQSGNELFATGTAFFTLQTTFTAEVVGKNAIIYHLWCCVVGVDLLPNRREVPDQDCFGYRGAFGTARLVGMSERYT